MISARKIIFTDFNCSFCNNQKMFSIYLVSYLIGGFCWYIKIVSKELIIVLSSSIKNVIWTSKTGLINALVYRINVWLMHGATDILSLKKLVLIYELIFSFLGSHLDIPEHILMTVHCRFIHSLVAINTKMRSWNIFISFTKRLWGGLVFK